MQPYIVSVIVSTRNEEKHIENCLKSIKAQDYPQDKIEIIIVDNNSSDKTKEIARRYTEKVYNCGPERSAQRNFGVRQAGGKYILYLDADMTLSKDTISESTKKCDRGDWAALYVPERIVGKGFWVKIRDFERSFYNATCVDCVRFVRRDKFLEIGGFDERLTGPEDWDFDRRIREAGRVDIISSPIYHDENEFNLRKYIRKKSYYARSFNAYIKKWGRNDALVKKQLGLWYRYFGIFIENKKWEKIFGHPILTIEMYFLRFLIGLVYLMHVCGIKYERS